jgi:hypothetical protein
VIAPLSVTENGTFTPPSGVDGYAPVVVNVASSGGTGENRLAMFMSDTLTDVTAEDFGSATTIQNNLFESRKALVSAVISESITSVGNYAFLGCNNLASVSFGENSRVKSIGNGAFSGCYSLKDFTIPSGVTYIGTQAFSRCGFENITFPSGVKNIGLSIFTSCSKLSILVLRSDSVVSLSNTNAFKNTPFAVGGTGGTCYVPQALIESYKTATNWSALYEAGTCNFVAIEGSEYE